MLAYTVKNYLKLLSKHAKDNKYELEMLGGETINSYIFQIEFEKINLVVKHSDKELLYTRIYDLDKFMFNDKTLKAVRLKETKFTREGALFEETTKMITQDSQLYITLFNAMDKKANFVFKHKDKKHKCFYIEGKTLLVEETDKEHIIKGTDLNHLRALYPGYNILYVNEPLRKMSYRAFFEEQEYLAQLAGKTLSKYKFHERVL